LSLLQGLVIGFDFGMRRIGMAIGHCSTKHTRPLPTLLAKQGEPDWAALRKTLALWKPEALIVGLPTHIDGREQYTTEAARCFAQALKAHFQLPVYLVDERLSTVEARSQLFEQGGYKKIKQSEIDSFAACVILEQWLQSPNSYEASTYT
jgi:putative Holliday junction resolvase